MAERRTWQFDESEAPDWARAAATAEKPPQSSWHSVPAPTPPHPLSMVARLFWWRTFATVALIGVVFMGRLVATSGRILECTLAAAFTGFAIGIFVLIRSLIPVVNNTENRNAGEPVHFTFLAIVSLVILPLMGPPLVFAALAVQFLFASRFLAMVVLAPACVALHYVIGPRLLRFSRDLMTADYLIDPKVKAHFANLRLRPDSIRLANILAIAVIVPAIFSVTLGIVAVFSYLMVVLWKDLKTFADAGMIQLVYAAIDVRSRHTVFNFCDYAPWELSHWHPSAGRGSRLGSMLLLTLALDTALVVALGGFFPWELCASFTVPGYSFPGALFTHYSSNEYRWFLTPLELAGHAQPPVFYWAGLLLAFPLFVLLPPAVMLATYLRGFVELETLTQEIEASNRRV